MNIRSASSSPNFTLACFLRFIRWYIGTSKVQRISFNF